MILIIGFFQHPPETNIYNFTKKDDYPPWNEQPEPLKINAGHPPQKKTSSEPSIDFFRGELLVSGSV